VASGQNAVPGRGRTLQIAVTDTGLCVPAEFREQVFDKFFRATRHLGREPMGVPGAGIGPYLCCAIVKAHGGTITASPVTAASARGLPFLRLPAGTSAHRLIPLWNG
jgi:signal transduction histidine kinase